MGILHQMIELSLKGKTVAIVGLGYVGLPLAVEFGKKRKVFGFDVDLSRTREVAAGYDRTGEVSSENLAAARYLEIVKHPDELARASVYIVAVPTPVDNANQPDLTLLERACSTVSKYLSADDVVIFESTVYPGATEEFCVPLLESGSGLRAIFEDNHQATRKGFYLGYSPERVNPGDKERRLPDIVKIVSGSTHAISRAIDELYSEIILAGTYLAPSIRVAEAAKVIENTQRDLNIAFVNELSMIFSKLGIDTNEVLAAAATKWNFLNFRPGLVGGHCIGVDPYYLTYKAAMIGHHPRVISAGRRVNDEMPAFVAGEIVKAMAKTGLRTNTARIGILGLTFKPNCPDLRNTKVVELINELESWGCVCVVHDPLVSYEHAQDELGYINRWN